MAEHRDSETGLIKAFIYGSCGVHDAPYALAPLRLFPYTFGRLGFRVAPYALSSGATIQLHDFCVGERRLPEPIRLLAYMDVNQPSPTMRGLVDDTDVAFIELSTPIEPMIGDDIVNFNRIGDYVGNPLRAAGVDRKLLSGWMQALTNVRDDLKERAAALLAGWPSGLEDDGLARWSVENLRVRRLGVDEIVRDLEILREKVAAPIALKLYDFKYMPDGRAIDWPAGFKSQQIEVAQRMKLPTLDFGPVIKRLGAERLIGGKEGDMAHWRRDVLGLQAELMYDFWATILDRPTLEAYSRWLEARPALYAALPELAHQPARFSFPDLATFQPSGQWRPNLANRVDTPAAMRPKAPSPVGESSEPLAERLNTELVELHRRRLGEMGRDPSGLFTHYEAQVGLGMLITDRHRRLLNIIQNDLPTYATYVVLRAGLGEFAFLLAASGCRVIACEPNGYRYAAIEAGRSHLEGAGALRPGALTVVKSFVPEGPMTGDAIAIGLDTAHVADDAAAAPLLAGMVIFTALLIDVRLFLRRRESQQERSAVAEALGRIGLTERRDFPEVALAWFRKSMAPMGARPRARARPGRLGR